MSDNDPFDETLDRELRELGPLMKMQQQTESEAPDPDFVSSLRARLVGEAQATDARSPRRSVPVLEPISLSRRRRLRPVFGAGLIAAAIAAAVVALVVNSRNAQSPGTSRPVAIAVPRPNPTELTRTFPLYGIGAGGRLPRPWETDLSFTGPGAPPYGGHLTLSAGPLPFGPPHLSAFRLAGAAFDARRIARIAQTLGIHGPVKYSRQPSGTWAYAEDLHTGVPQSIHSVAINTSSGELIYHDLRQQLGSQRIVPHNDPHNVALSRAWLNSLGWPGQTMPLHTTTATQETHMDWTVSLGWTGAGLTDTPEAVTFLATRGDVIGADVWPPVDRIFYPAVQGYAAAWPRVRNGTAPIGLLGPPIYPPKRGTGAVTRTDVVNVFTPGPNGRYWLVPAYRFRGTAQIHGVPTVQQWAALVPAVKP